MVLVVKLGGEAVEYGVPQDLLADLKSLALQGGLVIIHGGGTEVTQVATQLGKPQVFITSGSGIQSRQTDRETVEIYMMVMAGRIGKRVVSQLTQHGVGAVGLSGLDAGLLRAQRKERLVIVDERGRRSGVEGGYTGKITSVNKDFLQLLLNHGYTPVVAPVAIGMEGEPLNVDSDRAAAHIAGALAADCLLFLTDVPGLLLEGKLVQHLTLKEAKELASKVGAGMQMKLLACAEALELGVRRAVIASIEGPQPITAAYTQNRGTVVSHG